MLFMKNMWLCLKSESIKVIRAYLKNAMPVIIVANKRHPHITAKIFSLLPESANYNWIPLYE